MRLEFLIAQMRRPASGLADAEIDRGFTKIKRNKLRMQIGEMQQGHGTERLKLENIVLAQALLRRQAAEPSMAGARRDGGRGGCGLKKMSSRYHIEIQLRQT